VRLRRPGAGAAALPRPEAAVRRPFFPFGLFDERQFVERFTADGRDREVAEAFERARKAKKIPPGAEPAEPHIVFDMTELVRYVLFRERVFDARVAGATASGPPPPEA
jgi:hypothetical protein